MSTGTYCPSPDSFIGTSNPLTGSINFVGSELVLDETGDDGLIGGGVERTDGGEDEENRRVASFVGTAGQSEFIAASAGKGSFEFAIVKLKLRG